jgi:hypothetical protein
MYVHIELANPNRVAQQSLATDGSKRKESSPVLNRRLFLAIMIVLLAALLIAQVDVPETSANVTNREPDPNLTSADFAVGDEKNTAESEASAVEDHFPKPESFNYSSANAGKSQGISVSGGAISIPK